MKDTNPFLHLHDYSDPHEGIGEIMRCCEMLRTVCHVRVTFHFIFSVRITNYGTDRCLWEEGPGNEKWPVLKLTVAPLLLLYQIEHGPLSHWLKILWNPLGSRLNICHGPVCELRDFSECPKFIGLHEKRLGGGEVRVRERS